MKQERARMKQETGGPGLSPAFLLLLDFARQRGILVREKGRGKARDEQRA